MTPELGATPAAGRTVRVPVAALKPADSPRLCGVNDAYAQTLAASGATLPPILVNRRTMQIIDGMHRLRIAELRHSDHVDVRFVDVPDDAVFVLSVQTNTAHGLPLSFADRRSAAVRIIATHPQWSDRTIAGVAGLASKTVARIRQQAQLNDRTLSRIGADGKRRPLDAAERRQQAAELIAAQPEAPLRAIAATVGVSAATVHDVRRRLMRHEDPVPDGLRPKEHAERAPRAAAPPPLPPCQDRQAALDGLKRDPALRFSQSGRGVLRWIMAAATTPDQGDELMPYIPEDCQAAVAELARLHARDWLCFAEHLEQRASAGEQ